MRQWLFDVIVGAVLITSSIIPALLFTTFALKFWPPFMIIFAVGGTLVFFGFFKARVHDTTPVSVTFGRGVNEKDKSPDPEHPD